MPLKPKEVEKFKLRLEEMRNQLKKALQGAQAEVRRPDDSRGYSQHQADEGSDDFDRSINLEMTATEYDILAQVEHALSKIEDGNYGICDVTGDEIPIKRLEAVPYASMTVAAQEKLEKGLL